MPCQQPPPLSIPAPTTPQTIKLSYHHVQSHSTRRTMTHSLSSCLKTNRLTHTAPIIYIAPSVPHSPITKPPIMQTPPSAKHRWPTEPNSTVTSSFRAFHATFAAETNLSEMTHQSEAEIAPQGRSRIGGKGSFGAGGMRPAEKFREAGAGTKEGRGRAKNRSGRIRRCSGLVRPVRTADRSREDLGDWSLSRCCWRTIFLQLWFWWEVGRTWKEWTPFGEK